MDLHVAAIQMVSACSADENLARAHSLIERAALQGANWVILPEYWCLMGQNETDKLALAEDFGHGNLQTALSNIAQQYGITLFAGTIPLKSQDNRKIFNSLLTFNPQGECVHRYDKMHLFAFSGAGECYREADTIQKGRLPPALTIEDWRIASGICYDLRFAEFFRAQLPFDVLILPAAFTATTGKAHWEILLRARAIENQCYVIAAAQGGVHQNGRKTFGNSMIIDPWGEVLARCNIGENIVMATVSLQKIRSVRNHLPALNNRQHFDLSVKND